MNLFTIIGVIVVVVFVAGYFGMHMNWRAYAFPKLTHGRDEVVGEVDHNHHHQPRPPWTRWVVSEPDSGRSLWRRLARSIRRSRNIYTTIGAIVVFILVACYFGTKIWSIIRGRSP
jgi:hypothetical protein